jgi:hypothetical protein
VYLVRSHSPSQSEITMMSESSLLDMIWGATLSSAGYDAKWVSE